MTRHQVVILAGGLGTRLRPITETVPKPMVPVNGLPFLEWQLRDLKVQGFTRILLLVAYLGEQIQAYFGDGSSRGMEIEYVFEKEPLGTGGALKNAVTQLDTDFFLLNGDSYLEAPLSEMARAAKNFDAMVSVYDNRDPVPVIPNLKVSGDRVLAYEKDAGVTRGFSKIDSGIYFLKRHLVEAAPTGTFMLADLWSPLIASGRLGAFDVPVRFYDIGTVERLREFETYLKEKR